MDKLTIMATNKNLHAKGSPLGTDPCSECPVCTDQSLPPVLQCSHGHLICESCLPTLEKRSVCQETMPKRKGSGNYVIERETNLRSYPCKYKENGCEANLRYDQLLDHQSDCHYMPVKVCSILGLGGCEDKSVILSDFSRHVIQVHKLKVARARSKDKGGRNYVRWGWFAVDRSVTKNTNWVTHYFLTTPHEDRVIRWTMVMTQRKRGLEWRLFVLRGPAFVSRCRVNMSIMIRDSMDTEQTVWTTGMQWTGPCLGLEPSEEDMETCFVTPVSTIKKFIMKKGDQDCLMMKWKLMIEDKEEEGVADEEDGEDSSPQESSNADPENSTASTPPACITISGP